MVSLSLIHIFDGISVYRSRENMGTRLAQAFPIDADLVSDVPDSATPAASGYAAESGIPYAKALAKNRYVGRTFIQPSQDVYKRQMRSAGFLPLTCKGKH